VAVDPERPAESLLEPHGKFVSDYLNMIVGRYLGMLVGIVRGVLVPRLLDPAVYGIYKTFLLIPTYVRAGHLGAVSGLSRQIPYYRGKKDDEGLKAAVRVAYTFSLGSALLSCVVLIAYGFTIDDTKIRIALWIFLFFVVSGQQSKLQETYLIGFQRFTAVSRLNLAQNVYSTVLAVLGAWKFGLMGVIVATAIDGVVTLALYRWASGIGFPGFSFDRRVAKDLLSIGAPLLLTGLLSNVLFTVDRLVILQYFDATAMGYYALAATFVVYINDLSNLLSRVVFPRMVMRLGQDESVERLKHFVRLPITAASYAFPVFVIWIHYFCIWGFRLVYPKYEPGAGVMEVLTFSILPYSHFLSHMNLVVALKKQLGILWMYVVAILTTVAIAALAVTLQVGIEGIAAGAVAGMFVLSILLYFHSERYLLGNAYPWGRFWRAYGPTFWVAAVIGWDVWFNRGKNPAVLGSLLRAAMVTLLYVPVLVWAWTRDPEFREIIATARRLRSPRGASTTSPPKSE
jgi:O-antigen/teichoic acid export membrane protein